MVSHHHPNGVNHVLHQPQTHHSQEFPSQWHPLDYLQCRHQHHLGKSVTNILSICAQYWTDLKIIFVYIIFKGRPAFIRYPNLQLLHTKVKRSSAISNAKMCAGSSVRDTSKVISISDIKFMETEVAFFKCWSDPLISHLFIFMTYCEKEFHWLAPLSCFLPVLMIPPGHCLGVSPVHYQSIRCLLPFELWGLKVFSMMQPY